jgi:putative flippase GtrA
MDTVPATIEEPSARPSLPVALIRRILSVEQRRFIKFALVGASGVFVNLAVVFLFDRMLLTTLADGPRSSSAAVAGIFVSIFTNFLINDRWTWADRAESSRSPFWIRCRDFYVTSAGAAGIQFAVFWLTNRSGIMRFEIFGFHTDPFAVTLAALAGIAVATPINYFVNHFWTFRKR